MNHYDTSNNSFYQNFENADNLLTNNVAYTLTAQFGYQVAPNGKPKTSSYDYRLRRTFQFGSIF